MKIALVACPAWAVWAPNPALLVLSAQLEKDGHVTELFDLNIEAFHDLPECKDLWLDSNSIKWETKDLVDELYTEHKHVFFKYGERIACSKPDMICFTINSGARFIFPHIAGIIRELLPDTLLVIGGPDCFRSEFFDKHMIPNVVDALCMGEGDICLPMFANEYEKNRQIPKNISGFLFWDGDKIRDNGDPQTPANLDDLAPVSLTQIDLTRYTIPNRVAISISRGCINRCAFCSESPNFGKYRTHSSEWMVRQVMDLLPNLAASGKKPHINFNDSLINGNIRVLESFCDLVLARQLNFTWGGMAYIREEMTSELLEKMKNAGCVEICWGVESGSAGVLKAMRKRFTPTLLDKVTGDTARLGIAQYGNLIVGFPGESSFEFAETLLFLVKNIDRFTAIGLPIFTPRKNSPIYAEPLKFGLADLDNLQWKTVDGTNTQKVRLLRRDILSQVLQSKKFDQGRYDSLNKDSSPNILDPEVHQEYINIFRHFTELTRSYLSQAPFSLPLLQSNEQCTDVSPTKATIETENRNENPLPPIASLPSIKHSERLWASPPLNIETSKKINYYRYALSRAERRTSVLNTPLEIFLETANSCNLNCVFCAIRGKTPRPSGPSSIMQPEIMHKIEPLLSGMAAISLHGFGEPLLNRHLVTAASESVSYLAHVDFFTNGMLLNESRIKAIVSSQVPGFTVSISTADPGQYSTLYEKGSLNLLSKNLKMLLEEKTRQEKKLPVITFNTIAMRDTLPNLPDLVLFAAEHGVKSIELKPLVVYENMQEMSEQRITYDANRDKPILDSARDIATRFDIHLSTAIYESTKTSVTDENCKTNFQEAGPQWSAQNPCPQIFRTLYIRVDGKIKPCCFYANTDSTFLGDLKHQNIDEIWNGETYQNFRRSHLNGEVPPGCAHCFKFKLAPPSDASRHWLANNGVSVYDPFQSIELLGDATVVLSNILHQIDHSQKLDATNILQAAVELLKKLTGLAREFQTAKESIPVLSQPAMDAINQCKRLSSTLFPFMTTDTSTGNIRLLKEQLSPMLTILPGELTKWHVNLMEAIKSNA